MKRHSESIITAVLLVLSSHVSSAQTAAPAVIPGVHTAKHDGFLANEFERVDPKLDGWDTEVMHDAIKPRLKAFVEQLSQRQAWDEAALQEVCSPSLVVSGLRPVSLVDSNLAGGFVVRRPRASLDGEASVPFKDLERAVAAWLAPFADDQPVDIHTKIFRVSRDGNRGTATVYIDATGAAKEGGFVQLNATWQTLWIRSSEDAPWTLTTIAGNQFEEVVSKSSKALFTDITEAVLAGTEAWQRQLRYGIDHWRLRLETALSIEPGGINGLALGDVDGNGLEDLFYTDSGGLPKRLFLHQDDGTLRDATHEAGLDYLDRSRAALLVDFDNDGDLDLALALEDRVLILSNDGEGRFAKQATLPAAARVHGLAAADYDRDGNVDLYACSYGRDLSTFGEEGVPTPWNDANNGASNALFHNAGKWQFDDVTKAAGLDVNNNRFSFAASWEDFDRDGWPDLYVANDFGRNNLFRNQRGQFQDVAAAAHAEDISPGMACSWGDVNGDGWMDLHISNMFSGAGNRITQQSRYKASSSPEVLASHKRFARGNSLLLNNGRGAFVDLSEASGITLGRWAWGNQLADVNNDGHLDTLIGNGFITGPEEDDL